MFFWCWIAELILISNKSCIWMTCHFLFSIKIKLSRSEQKLNVRRGSRARRRRVRGLLVAAHSSFNFYSLLYKNEYVKSRLLVRISEKNRLHNSLVNIHLLEKWHKNVHSAIREYSFRNWSIFFTYSHHWMTFHIFIFREYSILLIIFKIH